MTELNRNAFEVDALADLFGSQTNLASAFGVGLSTVSMWKKNGIPATRRLELIDIAHDRGIALPEWVIPGPRRSIEKSECAA